MKATKATIFVLIFLVLATAAVAQTSINSPIANSIHYSSIVPFNITYNVLEPCSFSINDQPTETFECQNEFYLDVPYTSGQVNVSINQTSSSDSVTFTVNNNPNAAEGFIVGVMLLLPFLFAIFFLMAGYFMDKEEHAPYKLFTHLLAWTTLFMEYWIINIVIREYLYFPLLKEVFNTWWFGWVYFTVLAYFFTYITYKVLYGLRVKNDPYKSGGIGSYANKKR